MELLYPRPSPTCSRRSFLAGSASFIAAACLSNRVWGAVGAPPPLIDNPFTLGVASGDPTSSGVVLWTRLVPRPLEVGGGMPAEPINVSWVVAENSGLSHLVQRGTTVARPEWGHSVHLEIEGLRPERWYYYQFKVGHYVSPVGRTRTLPEPDAFPDRLRFVFASCQKFETGYYVAWDHVTREEPDLIFHLGDYIYEKGPSADALPERAHTNPELFALDDYRIRYGQYKSDPSLQAAHALAPWFVTWDDHEVANNYAGPFPEHPEKITLEQFLRRRAAGYQAYYEHMPLRRSSLPVGPDMLLYRRFRYGRLAQFDVLDTRQYRTDQPQGDGIKPSAPVLLDPRGTILGEQQRTWLFDGLERSPALWNVLAQQVMMARVDLVPGPDNGYAMDKWTGYEFERQRVIRHWRDHKTSNPVVITGDIHEHWANEILADFDNPDSPAVATELVGTSISSAGDGREKSARHDGVLSENPWVKFNNSERGYVRCEVNPQFLRADFRTVPWVSKREAPLNTRASFVIETGRAKLNRV